MVGREKSHQRRRDASRISIDQTLMIVQGAKISAVKTPSDDDDSSQLTEKNLKAWTAKYDQNKWDMAASKYFDMTGQHLAPEQVKKMMAK